MSKDYQSITGLAELSVISVAHCEELAEWILRDEPNTRDTTEVFTPRMQSLTRVIQAAIEQWIAEHHGDGWRAT